MVPTRQLIALVALLALLAGCRPGQPWSYKGAERSLNVSPITQTDDRPITRSTA